MKCDVAREMAQGSYACGWLSKLGSLLGPYYNTAPNI